jgi:hypothetical protein
VPDRETFDIISVQDIIWYPFKFDVACQTLADDFYGYYFLQSDLLTPTIIERMNYEGSYLISVFAYKRMTQWSAQSGPYTIDVKTESKLASCEAVQRLDSLFSSQDHRPQRMNHSARRCIQISYRFSAGVRNCQVVNLVVKFQLFMSLRNLYHSYGFLTSSSTK